MQTGNTYLCLLVQHNIIWSHISQHLPSLACFPLTLNQREEEIPDFLFSEFLFAGESIDDLIMQ